MAQTQIQLRFVTSHCAGAYRVGLVVPSANTALGGGCSALPLWHPLHTTSLVQRYRPTFSGLQLSNDRASLQRTKVIAHAATW